jgi:hypothetical protein
MTGDTLLRCPLVHAILMTACTRNTCMAPGQRELSCRMVEGRITPERRRVAQRAILREARIHVFGILGSVVDVYMAACAIL